MPTGEDFKHGNNLHNAFRNAARSRRETAFDMAKNRRRPATERGGTNRDKTKRRARSCGVAAAKM